MSFETLAGLFISWLMFTSLVCLLIGDWRGCLGAIGTGWFGPLSFAAPLSWFLLLDGEWSEGDRALLAVVLAPACLIVSFSRIQSSKENVEFRELERQWSSTKLENPSHGDSAGLGPLRPPIADPGPHRLREHLPAH